MQDQAKALDKEIGRLWKDLIAHQPSADSAIENKILCLGGADNQAQAQAELAHPVQQELQP